MSQSVAVSVIVPIFQVEQWLATCLRSLALQTCQSLQVILVNDASTDNSRQIAESFCQQHPERFELLNLPHNVGVSAARNIGMRAAKGEYIGFADSDDYVDSTMFERLYQAAVATDCDWVSCQMWQFANRPIEDSKPLPLTEMFDDTFIMNKLFKRSLLQQLKLEFYADVIFEDEPFVYIAKLSAAQSSQLTERLYHYRINPQGACRRADKQRFNLYDKKLMLVRFLADLTDRELLKPNRKLLLQCMANHALSALYYPNTGFDQKIFFNFLAQLSQKHQLFAEQDQPDSDYRVSRFQKFSQRPWLLTVLIIWLRFKPRLQQLMKRRSAATAHKESS